MDEWRSRSVTDASTAKKLWWDSNFKLLSRSTDKEVDQIFVFFCGLSLHSDPNVRALAINMLGTFHRLSMGTLMQTLSKTLIDSRPPFYRAADCGNFIHALEDEYQSVRNAVVDCLCELSVENSVFAQSAFDLLIDMLNDEMELVRLASIRSLKKVAFYSSVTVDDFQLQSLLTVFDDNNRVMREVAYELLQYLHFRTRSCLHILTVQLFKNLAKFEGDRHYILICLATLGRSFSEFADEWKDRAFNLDRRFLPQEQELENITHIANLVLLFNGALNAPKILLSLPRFTFKHFAFLRRKYPTCFAADDLETIESTRPVKKYRKILSEICVHGLQDVHILLQHKQPHAALTILTVLKNDIEICSFREGPMESIIAYFTFLLDSYKLIIQLMTPTSTTTTSLSSKLASTISLLTSRFAGLSRSLLQIFNRILSAVESKKRPRDGPIQTYIEDLHNALTKSFESSIKENRGTVIASRPSSKSILQYDGSVHLYTKANLHLIAYTASLEPIAYPIPRQTLTPTGLNQYRFTKTIHEPLLSSRKVDVAVALDGCDVSDAFFGTDMLRIDGKMLAVLRRLNDEEDKLNI